MSIEAMFENIYHENNLRQLKTEEEQQWENMRHEKEIKNINEKVEELEKD